VFSSLGSHPQLFLRGLLSEQPRLRLLQLLHSPEQLLHRLLLQEGHHRSGEREKKGHGQGEERRQGLTSVWGLAR